MHPKWILKIAALMYLYEAPNGVSQKYLKWMEKYPYWNKEIFKSFVNFFGLFYTKRHGETIFLVLVKILRWRIKFGGARSKNQKLRLLSAQNNANNRLPISLWNKKFAFFLLLLVSRVSSSILIKSCKYDAVTHSTITRWWQRRH